MGELAPSKESWPLLLLLLHTSTNVSLQAAAAASAGQRQRAARPDDAPRVIRRFWALPTNCTTVEKCYQTDHRLLLRSAHILHSNNKGASKSKLNYRKA